MKRFASVALGVAWLLGAATGFCQDLAAVAPEAVKIEYEDARIRVVRLRIPAGGTLPLHDRPARVVIPLTPNDVRTTRADGSSSEVHAPAGKAAWSEAARRSVTNLGGPLENIIVELKKAGAPARPLAHAPAPPPPGYLDEPFHHWQFENQYVRVYDVRIPPGATTRYHVHAFDSVFVEVTGGLVAEQPKGQPWGKAEQDEAGLVTYSADAQQPRTHRVRNEGNTEFHVVVVQVLP